MSERKKRHLDDLFGGPAEPAARGEQIEEIDENLIDPFPGHPFHMYQGRLREEMIESIRDFGVLPPITLWAQENGRYDILAGHNRDMCNREVGNRTIRSVVKRGLTMGAAKIIVPIRISTSAAGSTRCCPANAHLSSRWSWMA